MQSQTIKIKTPASIQSLDIPQTETTKRFELTFETPDRSKFPKEKRRTNRNDVQVFFRRELVEDNRWPKIRRES